MNYCQLVYVDRLCSGNMESLLVMDWYYQSWIGCYCKVGE